MIIDEYKNYLISFSGKKQSTADTYGRCLIIVSEKMGKPVEQLSQDDLQVYFNAVRNVKSLNTLHLEQNALISFYRWYCKKFSMKNPAEDLIPVKYEEVEPIIFTKKDFVAMIEIVGLNTFRNVRNAAILCLLADTGIRVSELCQLRVSNVERLDNNFSLNIFFETKNYRQRRIPFAEMIDGSIIGEIFSSYWLLITSEKKYKPEEPLFQDINPEKRGQFLVMNTFQQLIRRIGVKAGLKISIHSFRHFFATYSLVNGMDYNTLRHRMGHRKIESTMKYITIVDGLRNDTLKKNPSAGVRVPQRGFQGFAATLRKK